MTTIHMETEQVRAIASRLNQSALDICEYHRNLNASANRLAMAWDGGNANDFQFQIQACLRRLENQAEQLQAISLRLSREVEEWKCADQGFGISSGGASVSGSSPAQQHDWREWWLNFGGVSADLVDEMEILKHLVRGSTLQRALPLVGIGFGIAGDRLDGENWGKSIGSELAEFGMNLIPPLGVYSLALGVAGVASAPFDLLGYHSQAASLQSWIEEHDLSEQWGNVIYDFVTEHPQSVTVSTLFPYVSQMDPVYIRFTGNFWAVPFESYGLRDVSVYIHNTSENWAANMEGMQSALHESVLDFINHTGTGR